MKTPYIFTYSKSDNIYGGGSGGTNKFTMQIPSHEKGDGLLLYVFGGSRSHSVPVGWKALTPNSDPSNNRFHYKIGNGETTVDIFFKDTYFSGACICFTIKNATNNIDLITHKFFPETGYLKAGSNIVYCPIVDVLEDNSLCFGIFHNGRTSKTLSVTGGYTLDRISGSSGETQFAISSYAAWQGKSPLISFSGFPTWHDWIRTSTLIIPPQIINKSVIIQQVLGV